jgi:predicted nucleic acid-binding Zn ribbon protein
MTQQEKQTAEKLCRTSEYIKAAESFVRYAHKEWVEENADERALLMCCIDRTVPDGTGMMNVATGNKDLITAAVMKMMEDDNLGEVFRKARIVSETCGDMDENIRSTRNRLRTFYGIAALATVWTVCIVGFQIAGVANWITTVSNLLLMAFIGLQLCREIMESRRMLKRLTSAVRRDREERMEHHVRAFFDALRKRMDQDDDEEE